MHELNCEDVLMARMAEVDGEKPLLSSEQMSLHINSCENCRHVIEEMLHADSLLKKQARRQQDANLWPAVEKRLDSRAATQIGRAPFVLLGVIFVAYKLLEMLSESAPGLVFKLVPLIFVVGLFVLIRENPFRINAELTLER